MTRRANQLRTVRIKRRFTRSSPGSVLYQSGRTTVLCTASVQEEVPPWMKGEGKGWITAEYNMLPGSTSPRKRRDRGGKIDGRTTEIQRLIGRSLRSITDLGLLGEQMITVDCDVLQADGGTRTAAITGAYVALLLALKGTLPDESTFASVLKSQVAAVSVGWQGDHILLDLDYTEDSKTPQAALAMLLLSLGRVELGLRSRSEEAADFFKTVRAEWSTTLRTFLTNLN